MKTTTPEIPSRLPPHRVYVAASSTILLALSFGLLAGYLDIGVLLFRKYFWNSEGHFRTARDFPWTVPLGHAVLMLGPGLALAATNRLRPVPISLRRASWFFATLAIWSALLRMPLYGVCGLLLAAGVGRVIGDAVAVHGLSARQTRAVFAALIGVLAVLAFISSGWPALRERRAVAGIPPPEAPAARNVVLIVWDTVRAYNLGHYGYPRNTTPNLTRWARHGVTYKRALAPAPWTYPSHASFFTGQWPLKINSQWKFTLDAPGPTLAEYLRSRGYQTAGFVANTNCCSYESGLDRGFTHFDDYALTPRSLLTRTVAGNWALKNFLSLGDFYDKKWIGLQSRGAHDLTSSFFQWLGQRRPDRPFFAFLNYFDAHEPYIPPWGYDGRFGIQPWGPHDYLFLMNFVGLSKLQSPPRDLIMARDCYDDCIALLDDQLDRLLGVLERQGLLENTDVIITSDHGEGLGVHGTMGHAYTASLEEVGVPLVIISSSAPGGRVVDSPVSLRDLPATVVDMLGMSAASPFPGRSLAAYWKLAPGEAPAPGLASPAFSEQANTIAFEPQPGPGPKHPGFEMSLVASDHHYIRDGLGAEQLYNLKTDPLEQTNLLDKGAGNDEVTTFRRMLLDVLTDNPGSIEVEKAYLATYRKWLADVVRADSSQPLAARD